MTFSHAILTFKKLCENLNKEGKNWTWFISNVKILPIISTHTCKILLMVLNWSCYFKAAKPFIYLNSGWMWCDRRPFSDEQLIVLVFQHTALPFRFIPITLIDLTSRLSGCFSVSKPINPLPATYPVSWWICHDTKGEHNERVAAKEPDIFLSWRKKRPVMKKFN